MSRHSRTSRRRAGLTLVELLLALASTGLIAAAVAALMVSVSYGSSSRNDLRSLVVKSKTLTGRLNSTLRGAAAVLDLDTDSQALLLWTGDTRSDALPNISELKLLELDADTGTVRCYSPNLPTNLSDEQLEAQDLSYALDSNFNTIAQTLKSNGSLAPAAWATGVRQWQFTLNTAAAADASLVSFRITLTNGHLTNEVIGAAALRNRIAD
jgi:hypothetical protein